MRERLARLSFRLGLPLGVGLVLGVIGPFGTYHLLPLGPRMAYWLSVVSTNWLLADAIVRRVDAFVDDSLSIRRLLVPLSGACLAAVPATAVVSTANGLSGIGWPEDIAVLFGQVMLLLAAFALPVYTWEEMQERGKVRPGPSSSPTKPSTRHLLEEGPPRQGTDGLTLFFARLSKPLEGRLLCLEMQDHYLVVHHSGGSEMILCRMEDAARKLDWLGRRVHRSWWVANDAVASVEREVQRIFLRLTDDRRVPVSRSFRSDLKASKWL